MKILPAKHTFLLAAIFLLGISCYAMASLPAALSQNTISKEILDNGLTLIVKEEHSHPVVTVLVTVKAGLSSEGTYAGTGISHFLEHALFKGTARRRPGQVEEEIKSYGGMINAWTGLDSTGFVITVPKEHTSEAIALMEDIIFHPSFDRRELEKEKNVILKEIRLNNDDPARLVMRQLWRTAYLEHPYRLPLIGYRALFKNVTREDLAKYHALRYVPNNMILTVVGDVKKGDVSVEVKATFGKNKRKRYSIMATPLEPGQNSLREETTSTSINMGYLAMGYHTVSISDDDLYALDVLGIILGDWDGSRLTKELVKEKRLLYAVSSFNYTPRYPGLFVIYGLGEAAKLEKAKEEILEEIKKIKDDDIEEDDLSAAKAIVVSNYINTLETTGGIARGISQSESLAGDPSFFEKYVANIQKVGSGAVRKVAEKYLNEENLSISFLYPDYAGAEAEEPVPTEAESPVSTMTVLPNGIKLILREDHRIPKVALSAVFPGGVRVETKENNGISNLTSAMILKGTKERSEAEIRPFLEKKGGHIAHFSGRNSFGLSLQFLKEDSAGALAILGDVIMQATFPEEELDKEKEKIYAAIKTQDDDVFSTGILKLREALFENYPYGMRAIGEADSVAAITRDDVVSFYKKYLVSRNLIISVVGDFESSRMRREIEERFRDMPDEAFDIKVDRLPGLAGMKEISYEMAREQSLIATGFRGTVFASPDKYSLDILSSVFSGENGRLYRSVRNEMGLAYALGTFSVPGVNTGFITSYIATDKEHMEKAQNILLKELKRMNDGAISDEEIKLAKTSLIGRQKIALQSYGALAHKMALNELYGVGYDAYMNYPRKIERTTKEEIVKCARKYFDLRNFVSVKVTGERGGAPRL